MQVPISLVPYDPRWPAFFELERGQLAEVFAESEIVEVNHIGSTAVPGLSAKPVIDIQIAVPELRSPDSYMNVLAPLGYMLGESGENERRIVFLKREPQAYNLHFVKHGNSAYQRHIQFRDALLDDAQLAAEYGDLKQEVAGATDNVEDYSDQKTDFITGAIESRRATGSSSKRAEG